MWGDVFKALLAFIPEDVRSQLLAQNWFYLVLGIFLLAALIVAFRKPLLAFLLRDRYRAHDTRIFREWRRLLPEQGLADYLDALGGNRACLAEHIDTIEGFLIYSGRRENRFLLPKVRKPGIAFGKALDALFAFAARQMEPVNDTLYMVKPHTRRSSNPAYVADYQQITEDLDKLIERVGKTYTAFTDTANRELPDVNAPEG